MLASFLFHIVMKSLCFKQMPISYNDRYTRRLNTPKPRAWRFAHLDLISVHLGDLLSPVLSLHGEQSVVLAFHVGAQNAHTGQIKRPCVTHKVKKYFVAHYFAKRSRILALMKRENCL